MPHFLHQMSPIARGKRSITTMKHASETDAGGDNATLILLK